MPAWPPWPPMWRRRPSTARAWPAGWRPGAKSLGELTPAGGKGGWSGATLKLAPINTSGALRSNLYAKGSAARPEDPLAGMSVTAMSATLPAASVLDLGLGPARKVYPSPFVDAYRASALFVPRPEVAALARPGTRSLDTARHPEWAAPMIEALVEARVNQSTYLGHREEAFLP